MILAISMPLRVYTNSRIGNILVSRLRATVKHYINIMDIIHTESHKENEKRYNIPNI